MTLNNVSEEIMEAILEYLTKGNPDLLNDLIDDEVLTEDQANEWVPKVNDLYQAYVVEQV